MRSCLLYCFLFVLLSCELIVDIDVPFEQKQLTINSIFQPDSVWTSYVSFNQHILDSLPIEKVTNATVIVYHNDVAVDTLYHLADGVYRSDTGKPEIGKLYKITAVAPGYTEVSGSSYIPVSTTIKSVDVTTVENESTVRVTFFDNPADVNYYQIILEQDFDLIAWPGGKIRTMRHRIPIESDDPSIESNEYIGYNGILIRDIFFQNGEGVVSFNTFINQGYAPVIVTVRTVSEDYYRYKTTGDLQDETSGNPFAQPVGVYNNILNGFGLVAGFSESGYFIGEVVPSPIIHSITPLTGKPGDRVIITGENLLRTEYPWARVTFTAAQFGAPASIAGTPSENQIEVIVPEDAVTGKIYITNGIKITASDEVFEVKN